MSNYQSFYANSILYDADDVAKNVKIPLPVQGIHISVIETYLPHKRF